MVDSVGRPEPAHAVARAMEPVVAELDADEEQAESNRPTKGHGRNAVVPRQGDDGQSEAERQICVDNVLAPEGVDDRGESGAPAVWALLADSEDERFHRRQHNDYRRKINHI